VSAGRWSVYTVAVRLIETGVESRITVRALSKADALWRAVNRTLDTRYVALSAVKEGA